jgi:type II secretory ATPase GspE/PulE/Tfp pilus assembly ATPase PilB-like protein
VVLQKKKILEVKGEYLNIPIKHINPEGMSFNALKYISEDSATHYKFVPIELKDGVLEVGVTNPESMEAMDALQFISTKIGIPFKVFLISKSDYESIMGTYKGINSEVEEALDELNQNDLDYAKGMNEENLSKEIKNIKSGEEEKIVEDAPVIKIVAVILRNATEGETSLSEDGSLEKVENNLEVARIKMVEFLEYSKEKVLQEVKINLHRLLHLFVIFFKFISDLSDAMYVFSRDFFLKTATKEKNSVSTFWHHLKEYKKEKEQEKEGS